MLHNTNLRTAAIGVSALGIAAAGIATVAMGGSAAGRHGTHAHVSAGRTVIAQAETSHLSATSSRGNAFSGTRLSSALETPAAENQPAGESSTTRLASNRATTASATATSLPKQTGKPLVSAHVGDGPTTVQVDTDQVLATVSSTVKTATNTVSWAKSTVDRTVQSLPVKAGITQDRSGTTVTVSTLGTTAAAHVG